MCAYLSQLTEVKFGSGNEIDISRNLTAMVKITKIKKNTII